MNSIQMLFTVPFLWNFTGDFNRFILGFFLGGAILMALVLRAGKKARWLLLALALIETALELVARYMVRSYYGERAMFPAMYAYFVFWAIFGALLVKLVHFLWNKFKK